MLSYFILMRLYYANVLHVEFTLVSRGPVLLILTLLLTGAVAVGQLATPPQRHDWLARLGWRQWGALTALAAILTPLITTDYRVNTALFGDMGLGNVYDAAYFGVVARLLTDLVRDEHAKVAQQQQVANHAQNKDKRSHR